MEMMRIWIRGTENTRENSFIFASFGFFKFSIYFLSAIFVIMYLTSFILEVFCYNLYSVTNLKVF